MNKDKITQFFKPYIVLVLLFIFMGIIFNTIETISFCKIQNTTTFSTILQSYFNIIAVFSLYSAIILPFYLLIGILNKKIAQILVSVLFSILVISEIGLYIYYTQAGVLMGSELIIRPISETIVTIRNSSDITTNLILIISVIAFFIALPFFLKKIKAFNKFLSTVVAIIIIGIFSALTIFYQKNEDRAIDNYLESKTYHFFSAIKTHLNEEEELDYSIQDKKNTIERNEKLLQEYIDLYNNKSQADIDYPMERSASEFPDVLSPFFRKSEKQPNIVIIIVESLGNYLLGDKGNGIYFTPFLDSLAGVGLYWRNCLSTTMRTYGVLPAVIGSVPHGMRGFQFGVMPQHHSLFSILKNNDYSTNFFYGGNLTFDNMLDFVSVQETDHIADFFPDLKSYKKKQQANWWGLYDHVLFEESLVHLKSLSKEKSNASVYLTLTTHDPFNRDEMELKEYYITKADKIFSKLDAKTQKYYLPVKDKLSVFLYVDDCVKKFINDYSKQIDAENTLFFITGDHAVDVFKNTLSYYSVPLIIWSPLLKTSENFPNIVSHLAITPSIISFLQNNYGQKTSDKLAWQSMGLDTSSVFNPSEKILSLSYERKVNAAVYNQYYFEVKERRLYEIDENLDLEEIKDDLLIENIYSKFNTLKYVNNYVYHNDKLIKTNNFTTNNYKLIKTYTDDNTIICRTPDTIPSIAGIDKFDIMPVQKIKNEYNKVKIKLMADIMINDFVYQDNQMMLNVFCKGTDFSYEFRDHITKYIEDENIECGKKYSLVVEKEIDVHNTNNISVHIFVSTNISDKNWAPDKKITISNVKVLIYGK